MRNLEPQSNASSPVPGPSPARPISMGVRTLADATSVLLELARALRGFATFGDERVRRRGLAERAFQAVRAEIGRSGPLEIAVRGETFSLSELPERLDARGGLAILRSALAHHSVERLRLDPSLSLDALHGLLELLVQPSGTERSAQALYTALCSRDARGVHLNDLEPAPVPPPRELAATAPRPSVSVTTPRIEAMPLVDPVSRRGSAPAARQHTLAHPEPSVPTPLPVEVVAPPAPPAREALEERLRARLVELDHLVEDEPYARLAVEIAGWARELFDAGLRDACHRAMTVLADHAVGCGGRAESQARIAAECYAELASGERLEDLIDRALASDEAGVRAAQLLLQRREAAVCAIFARLCASADPLEPGPLHALVITSGEAAVPTLLEHIASPDENRARLALRLAGELQNPALLPALERAARRATLPSQIEAIRSLCLLPGEASRQALADALSSQLDQIAIAATQAIATRNGIDAVPALLDVLETHVRSSRTQLCRALIEVLGRLGDERAVPRLAAILERRPVLRRAHWHAIQLAAVDALAVLPTREARRAVERAASFAAAAVRDRARQRLSDLAGDSQAR
ncbi:MAG: hypothetical protein IPK00_21490 [Deltaproteobacteria bacterium]|nr:hypothetical protein [Deltaproteobacteria bacterium]